MYLIVNIGLTDSYCLRTMIAELSTQDKERIESILSYWFDGDQSVNYRTRWFPDGNSGMQAAADNEVNRLFADSLSDAMARKLDHWESHSRRSCIALILVLDQLSRHIFRLKGLPSGAPERLAADSLALEISKRFHSDTSSTLNLPMAEYVFSLMPMRHTATIDHLTFILDNLKGKEDMEAKSLELLNKFRKQTVRRLQALQDRAKLEATDDILERSAFVADETDIMNDPLVKTTESFLRRQLGMPEKNSSQALKEAHIRRNKGQLTENTENSTSTAATAAATRTEEGVTMFISLSGGVDSMVLSKILKLLQKAGEIKIRDIVGIHIDYANRPESGREAEYVSHWCSDLLGISYRVRVINEVTRGITSRDEYEKVARDIRYSFYKECTSSVSSTNNNYNNELQSRCGIIFGHHMGDVQENVISNVMRGVSPLDLSGMSESSVTNNVLVWRPLLNHHKDEIYAFAHRYGVPYFKDSTPSWSTRGKLRNQLVPLLVEMYGEGCLRNISALAEQSDQMRGLVNDNIYDPFMRSVERFPCGLKVNVLPYVHQPLCFWREVLKDLMHSMHMCMVRDKAVSSFVERLQKRPSASAAASSGGGGGKSSIGVVPGWLELRKGFHTLLNDRGELIVLRDGVLSRALGSFSSATTQNQINQRANKKGKNRDEDRKQGADAPVSGEASLSAAAAPTTAAPASGSADRLTVWVTPVASDWTAYYPARVQYHQAALDQANKRLFDRQPVVEAATAAPTVGAAAAAATAATESSSTAAASAAAVVGLTATKGVLTLGSWHITVESQVVLPPEPSDEELAEEAEKRFRDELAYFDNMDIGSSGSSSSCNSDTRKDASESDAAAAAAAADGGATCSSYRNKKKQTLKRLHQDKITLLSSLEEVLQGSFSYTVSVPPPIDGEEPYSVVMSLYSDLSHSLVSDASKKSSSTSSSDATASAVAAAVDSLAPLTSLNFDLHKMETKLREGLPLLLFDRLDAVQVPAPVLNPLVKRAPDPVKNEVKKIRTSTRLKLTYRYEE